MYLKFPHLQQYFTHRKIIVNISNIINFSAGTMGDKKDGVRNKSKCNRLRRLIWSFLASYSLFFFFWGRRDDTLNHLNRRICISAFYLQTYTKWQKISEGSSYKLRTPRNKGHVATSFEIFPGGQATSLVTGHNIIFIIDCILFPRTSFLHYHILWDRRYSAIKMHS